MASPPSGNSFTSTTISGSEENLQLLMDQRKRKRKESNRESAKRSRMRKQKHFDDLNTQVDLLRKENSEILTSVNITTQHCIGVEAENCILKTQMAELSQRLQSLNDIINLIKTTTTTTTTGVYGMDCYPTSADNFMNPMNMLYLNQPIMASADMFQW